MNFGGREIYTPPNASPTRSVPRLHAAETIGEILKYSVFVVPVILGCAPRAPDEEASPALDDDDDDNEFSSFLVPVALWTEGTRVLAHKGATHRAHVHLDMAHVLR